MNGRVCLWLAVSAVVTGCVSADETDLVTAAANPGGAVMQGAVSPTAMPAGVSPSAASSAQPGTSSGSSPTQPSGAPTAGVPVAPDASGASTMMPVPVPVPGSAPPAGPVEWTMFNYDHANSRNNRTETKITLANVATLTEKWTRELQGGVSSTPIVVGGKVYVNDHGGSAYRLDAATGAVEWQRRGLYSPRVGTNLVVGDLDIGCGGANMYAMKVSDGSMAWTARISTHPMPMIDSSPIQVGNLIVVGVGSYEIISSSANYTARGAVIAINMADGKQAWQWYSTANDANEGGGVSVWSSVAYDAELKMVWIGTGNAYEPPVPKTANALVALNAETGELVWSNQFHPEDVYTQPGGCQGPGETSPKCDFDVGASPNLFMANGKAAVGVGSKGGLYRAFERANGTMIWERQLGSGTWWGGVMVVAATDDNTIYVTNNNFMNGENLFALDMNSGDIKWMTPIPAAVWGALTIVNGVLFTTGKDGMMRAYEAASGKEVKSWDLGHDAASGVAITDGVVYASSGFTGQGSVTRPGARVTAFTLP